MKAKHLDYILDCIIEKFLSLMSNKDIKEFESKYPDYKYDFGFKNAIKGWSNNKTRREISLCRIIDLIEEKSMMNLEEKNIQDTPNDNIIDIEENSLQDTSNDNIIDIEENSLQDTQINDIKEK